MADSSSRKPRRSSPAKSPQATQEVPSAGGTAPRPWDKWLRNKPLVAGVAGGVVLLIAVIAFFAFSGGNDDLGEEVAVEEDQTATTSGGKKSKSLAFKGTPLDPPEFKTVACKIYTPEPGFLVLVDGVPALDSKGALLNTPCEIGVTTGNHTITVAKKGFAETSLETTIARGRTLEFTPNFEPFEDAKGYLSSRFARAGIGEELPLSSLNASGPVWDPCVSPDGLTIWFACDNPDHGKGISFARRASVWEEFGPPEFIATTRGPNRAASPSITANGLLLVFSVPERAVLWGVTRDGADFPFSEKVPLTSSDREDETWPAAQVAGDGLKIYSVQDRGDKRGTYITSRKSSTDKFGGKWGLVRLPGGHPCLSHDSLRQYSFAEGTLYRSSRQKASAEFSPPESIAELELRHFVPRDDYRQFWVSEDEQWFYYTDDPERSGNLYVTRIADGPGWGFVARGKSIPQIQIAAVGEEPSEPAPTKSKGKAVAKKPSRGKSAAVVEEPDDTSPNAPLPYVAFRVKLDALLAQWDFAAAEQLILTTRSDRKLVKDAELLDWDLEDVRHMLAFWNALEASIKRFAPKETVRIAPAQIEFEKFADGKLYGTVKGSTRQMVKDLKEMTPVDLVAIVEKTADRSSEQAHLQMAAFLTSNAARTTTQTIAARLQRAGALGKTFSDRQGERKLRIIEQEFARDNIAGGLPLVEQLIAAGAKTEAATKAIALRDGLYTRTTFRPIGGQKWTGNSGEFITSGTRSPNSCQLSIKQYGNFLLTLEWKATTDTSVHGGVHFRYAGGDTLRGNSFKLHLANDYALRAQPDKFSTGALLGLSAPKSNAVKRPGEWNTLVLRVEGDRVRVNINGTEVLDAPAIDPKIGPKGHVCLDGEVPGISYRKVLLYELHDTGDAKSTGKMPALKSDQ